MDATTRELNDLKEEVENLKRRNIKLEAYTRRENIKIFGIKESAGETNEKTEELVRIMLKEKIPGDCVDGIKWPDEPIKALGVYYSYDPKLLHEKYFIEKLDSIKKLIHIRSSRGLSIYGKMPIIKSLIIPKFVYIVSPLPTPTIAIKELNILKTNMVKKNIRCKRWCVEGLFMSSA